MCTSSLKNKWIFLWVLLLISELSIAQKSPWAGNEFDLLENVSQFDSLRIHSMDGEFTWGLRDSKAVNEFLFTVSGLYNEPLTHEQVKDQDSNVMIQRYIINDGGIIFVLEKHFKGNGIYLYMKNGKAATEKDFFRLLLVYDNR